jgi:hypothetical protein
MVVAAITRVRVFKLWRVGVGVHCPVAHGGVRRTPLTSFAGQHVGLGIASSAPVSHKWCKPSHQHGTSQKHFWTGVMCRAVEVGTCSKQTISESCTNLGGTGFAAGGTVAVPQWFREESRR